ncbi:MAG TPA: GNAT family N-acetyltransferase [Polyangiaceae bacterium]
MNGASEQSGYTIEVARVDDFDEIVRIDDEATALYAETGLELVLGASHPFSQAEQARWRRSAELGRLFFAVNGEEVRVGLAALDELDEAAYLDQLSVRRSAMRRGAGRFLLHHAIAWAENAGHSALWLTTYGHLPWNVPFYTREGFELVPESECGADVRHHLDDQRRWLPLPEQRVAMRRLLHR